MALTAELLGKMTFWILLIIISRVIYNKIKKKEKAQKFLEKKSKDYRESNFEKRRNLLKKEMEKQK